MKNMIRQFGVIFLAMVIGFSMAACASSPSGGTAPSAASAGTITSLTITGIPSQYDGKFVMMTLDTGGSGATTLAWGTRTISGTSVAINLLDWVTDQPTAIREGNYGVNIFVAANMQAIVDDEEEFIGIIMSRAFAGETVSVEWGEFMDMTN